MIMLIGVFVSDRYSKKKGEKDPKEVVIDEVVGTWFALYGHSTGHIIAGLFCSGYLIYLSLSQFLGPKRPQVVGDNGR